MQKFKVLNVEYDNVTLQDAADDIAELAKSHESRFVVTPNAEIAENCFKNEKLFEAISNADYVIPDGIGVVIASRIVGNPLKERVAGYDLACALLPKMEKEGLSLYLLGAKKGIADLAAENMKKSFPGLKIKGFHHGYFENSDSVINEINDLEPDVLFVAFGSPKQEIWMFENKDKLKVGVMMGIGGGIDHFAGIQKRAPEFFIKCNLEWLYRLVKQPSRFKRDMALPAFMIRALKERFFSRKKRNDINEG